MSLDERKAALSGDFGRSFHITAAEHVTWIFWTRATEGLTDILGHASAFLLDRGKGPMLVTAAHVFRQYMEDMGRFGGLYCQIANVVVKNLNDHLIACGNPSTSFDHRSQEPDIATFRLPVGAAERIGTKPIMALSDHWPPPPKAGEQVMFAGYPGQERIYINSSEINFGFHSGM